DGFLDVVEFSFLQRLVELLLKIAGHRAQLRRHPAEGTQHLRQILRSDDHDHDDRNHQHLGPADLEHGLYPAPLKNIQSERDQLLEAFSLAGVTDSSARCSTVLGASSAGSSSAMPFLKLLMPLAMSPISSGILPRPNTRSTTTSTISQCQIENEPILLSSQRFSGYDLCVFVAGFKHKYVRLP